MAGNADFFSGLAGLDDKQVHGLAGVGRLSGPGDLLDDGVRKEFETELVGDVADLEIGFCQQLFRFGDCFADNRRQKTEKRNTFPVYASIPVTKF